MKILSGSYVSDEYDGEIWFEGERMDDMNVSRARSLGIEMVYQETNAFLDGSIQENLFVGSLPGKGAFVDFKTLSEKTKTILEEIEINAKPQIYADRLAADSSK